MSSVFADPPLTPKAEATRARLLEVAAEVFVEQGYAAVSLRDIAVAAGVTKGAIYGHFRSKGQLLVEVIRTQLAERDTQFDAQAAVGRPMETFFQFINPDSRHLRLLQIDAAAAARHDPDVAAGVAEIFSARNAWILDTLRRLDAPEVVLYVINALSAGVGVQEAHGRPAPDPVLWSKTVARMLGMLEPPSSVK